MQPLIVVTAAIICRGGKILIAQRRSPEHLAGLWEFPGGRVEVGENLRSCLKREIAEELGIRINVGPLFLTVKHDYGEHGSVLLHSFWCMQVSGEPAPSIHADVQWVTPEELSNYRFAPADIPIVERLQKCI